MACSWKEATRVAPLDLVPRQTHGDAVRRESDCANRAQHSGRVIEPVGGSVYM